MRKILMMLLLMCLTGLASAAVPDNSRSLAGLKTVGVIFDVNTGDPQKLLLRLKLIEETVSSVTAAGVSPDVVVAFRGGASLFVTRGDKYLPKEDLDHKKAIQAQIKHLIELGYRLEQCAVAVRLLKIDPQDVIDDVPLVGNGYISLIGYQNRGYAFIPMD